MEKINNTPKTNPAEMITRKEAINKVGKYAAFTAASMMLLMSPVESSAKQQSIKKPKKHKP